MLLKLKQLSLYQWCAIIITICVILVTVKTLIGTFTMRQYNYGIELTPNERRIKQLGVENGERAKYLFKEINKFKTDEKQFVWQEWIDKKILTEQVADQLIILLRENGNIE